MKIALIILFSIWLNEAAAQRYVRKQISTYLHQINGIDSFRFGKKTISFDIAFIAEDVIKERYVENFSYDSLSLNRAHEKIVQKVEDSIAELNDRLNKICDSVKKSDVFEDFKKNRSVNTVVFTSKICENMVYVELADVRSVYFVKDHYEYNGSVKQFLFYFKKGKIIKAYKSYKHID
jgi:hypothetical protein